ncbi:UNVERIFIED_CONTAM: hypothetical protein FKN15_012804 [Acipenser sinensis]
MVIVSQVKNRGVLQVLSEEDYYNYSESYTDYPEPTHTDSEPCKLDSTWRINQSFMPAVYSLIFLLGLLGNLLVLAVVSRYKRRAFSLTDTFLVHLAVADLLLVVTLPFYTVQYTSGWIFGSLACKITGWIFSVNLFSTVLFLACISFDRYLAIVHVVQLSWRQNSWYAHLACAVVWAVCSGLSVVDFYFHRVLKLKQLGGASVCMNDFDSQSADRWKTLLHMLNLVLGFALPLLVMLYCYIMIFRSLCHAPRLQKQKSLKVIVSIVVAFILCWAPYNALQLVEGLVRVEAIGRVCALEKALDVGILVTQSLGLAHCCLNPLLYAFVGVKFRKELARLFKSLGELCRRGQRFNSRNGSSSSCSRLHRSRKNTSSRNFSSDSETSTTAYSVMF